MDLEDLRESDSLPLTVTVAINYTDQVVQPRSTSLNLRLDGFEGVSTLCQKEVPLRVRIMPTETSLSRISSALFSGDKVRAVALKPRRLLAVIVVTLDDQPARSLAATGLFLRHQVHCPS